MSDPTRPRDLIETHSAGELSVDGFRFEDTVDDEPRLVLTRQRPGRVYEVATIILAPPVRDRLLRSLQLMIEDRQFE